MSLESVLLESGFVEKSAADVYGDVFRLGRGLIQSSTDDSSTFKTKPIVYMRNDGAESGRYRLLFEDEFERCLCESWDYDFAITNGLTYFGRKMTLAKASKLYCLIIDLDGQTDKTLRTFLHGCGAESAGYRLYPMPNYINLSGHNVHLMYVLDEPLDLYPNIKQQLKEFKYALIRKVWNGYTSTLKIPQYQGINQGFRPIGGKTKIEGVRVRSFASGREHWSIQELNEYIPQESRIDVNLRFADSQMSFAEAAAKWPEWAAALGTGYSPRKPWHVSRNLYEWAKRVVYEGATYHHRYFCLMLLCMCGVKCSYYDPKKNPNPVTLEEVKKDIEEMRPWLDMVNPDEPMTDADISSALECFDPAFITFPRKDIERLTAIPMPQQRRNGRKRDIHLARARAAELVDYPNREWINRNGAPTKREQILGYAAEHPAASNREIASALGVSRTTVNKWIRWAKENPEMRGSE